MVSRTMMTVLLGIPPDDPAIRDFIQAADDVVNSIFSLPINFPGFAFRKVKIILILYYPYFLLVVSLQQKTNQVSRIGDCSITSPYRNSRILLWPAKSNFS